MEHSIFVDNENILLVTHHDEDIDYDDENHTPNNSKADEGTFETPDITEKEATLTLWLR